MKSDLDRAAALWAIVCSELSDITLPAGVCDTAREFHKLLTDPPAGLQNYIPLEHALKTARHGIWRMLEARPDAAVQQALWENIQTVFRDTARIVESWRRQYEDRDYGNGCPPVVQHLGEMRELAVSLLRCAITKEFPTPITLLICRVVGHLGDCYCGNADVEAMYTVEAYVRDNFYLRKGATSNDAEKANKLLTSLCIQMRRE